MAFHIFKKVVFINILNDGDQSRKTQWPSSSFSKYEDGYLVRVMRLPKIDFAQICGSNALTAIHLKHTPHQTRRIPTPLDQSDPNFVSQLMTCLGFILQYRERDSDGI